MQVLAALIATVSTAGQGKAQDSTRVRPDTTAALPDSVARRDSAARAEVERQRLARLREFGDTIKVPLAHSEVPVVPAIGEPYAWNREGLPATGALTMGELLARVPGITVFRPGWIGAPELAAWLGRFGRVRVFLDGIELDGLNARLGGLLDLSSMDMWQVEDATIEPGADEVRVHLRTWRVRSTIPVTRMDITTGDLQTNLFRGYYGRRFPGGQALQLGGHHFTTTDRRTSESGDHTSLWGRLGIARGSWSADVSVLRSGRKFTERATEDVVADTTPTLDGLARVAIARVAWGDPASGPWAQVLASAQSFTIRNPPLTVIDSIEGPGGGGPGGSATEPDTLKVPIDTTQSRPQYVLTGGWNRGAVRLSGAGRVRRWRGETFVAPALRASYENTRLAASLFGERSPLEHVQRIEAVARVSLPGNLALSGTVGQRRPIDSDSTPRATATRVEVGYRTGRIWWSVGAITRDTADLPAAVAFDTTFRGASQGATTGYFATVRGKFYRDIGLDFVGVRYPEAGVYRPQYQTRTRLYLDSDMRARFPSGNLNIRMAVTHEYRSQAWFPTDAAVLRSSQYRTWAAELEIRLLTATLFFQYRNFLAAEYQQVPGFTMPSITSIYGIRWNFAN